MHFAYTTPIASDILEAAVSSPYTRDQPRLFLAFAAFACLMCAVAFCFGAWADKQNLLDRWLADWFARGVAPTLALPVTASPLSSAVTPSAVWCDASRRWRCPATRKFVKAPQLP